MLAPLLLLTVVRYLSAILPGRWLCPAHWRSPIISVAALVPDACWLL
jgi:hypothetical protein